ncbi:MAG: S8 family serine peptidase, partial [Actinomycetota bacterium]
MAKLRIVLSSALVLALVGVLPGLGAPSPTEDLRRSGRDDRWREPLMLQARNNDVPNRYFVELKAAPAGQRIEALRRSGAGVARRAQRDLVARTAATQEGAVAAVRASGSDVLYRYSKLVNAFSFVGSADTARTLAARSDVARVMPVGVVTRDLFTSVPFIGAPQVWEQHDATGEGVRVAVVDTGVDYTHADFGGAGTRAAYRNNDPEVIEPGTFPTEKVVDGFDFVGGNYDVLDDDPSNDTPQPDPDPLDDAPDGLHGTHVAGICCGEGVGRRVGAGVAPDASVLAYKVWHSGNSTADVLVAAYERAMDPNQDDDMSDAVDIIQFSGGVDFGTQSSLEAEAAQQAVDLGTTFVASAGNSGNKAAGFSPYIHGTPASAPGVISVAASIDQFEAQTTKVRKPKGRKLPSKGMTVYQDWSGSVKGNFTDRVVDA